jgi:hypothetical protein
VVVVLNEDENNTLMMKEICMNIVVLKEVV